MEKISMEITLCGGVWKVNNRKLSEMNQLERQFLENFFRELRLKDNQILK